MPSPVPRNAHIKMAAIDGRTVGKIGRPGFFEAIEKALRITRFSGFVGIGTHDALTLASAGAM